MWTGVWGWTASPLAVATAPTAGACVRARRARRTARGQLRCAPHADADADAGGVTGRGNGEGLSSGSQLTCTFFFYAAFIWKGVPVFLPAPRIALLLLLALVELFDSLSLGFYFVSIYIILYSGCGMDFISFSKA
jgi:hypothetical protein